MATTLKVVEQNTAPQFQITCQRDDGTIIDLTNCSITFNLYKGSTQTNPSTATTAATVLNPATAGIIGWTPQTGDFSGPGTFKADVQVNYVNNTSEVLYGQAIFKARKLGG